MRRVLQLLELCPGKQTQVRSRVQVGGNLAHLMHCGNECRAGEQINQFCLFSGNGSPCIIGRACVVQCSCRVRYVSQYAAAWAAYMDDYQHLHVPGPISRSAVHVFGP